MNLYIDIETIPDQSDNGYADFLAKEKECFKAPQGLTKTQACSDLGLTGNDAKFTSKDDAISMWEKKFADEKAPEVAEAKWLKTSFDGSKGEIACISWAINDGEVVNVYRALGESEKDLIQGFFNALSHDITVEREAYKVPSPVTWIGHNVISFDMRFLWLRCVILGIKTNGIKIPVNARHESKDAYDTLTAWRGFGAKAGGSMDAVCKALGFDGKGDINGADVWPYMKEGKHDEVAQYCNDDVERTRQMYLRMTAIPT